MTKKIFFFRLLFAAALCCAASAPRAQEPATPNLSPAEPLHVVKSSVNAESDNAELCLEFDQPLAPSSPQRLASALKLEEDGKAAVPQNIATAATSLCLFPLDRGVPYDLTVAGLRGANSEKMALPYSLSFTIPDRSPLLAFTGRNGGVTGFGSYDDPLTLRAVNVAHVNIAVYRIADPVIMAHAWQDRAQTTLAPSESAYLARDKGQLVWQGDSAFDTTPNITVEQKMSLREKLPNLAPGLYLIVADANDNENGSAKPASKGLAPLTAAWFTKSDFSIRAVRDETGIHVFAAQTDAPGAKTAIHLVAMSRKPEQIAEANGGADGLGLIAIPADNADQNDAATVVASDAAGDVAFADIGALPPLTNLPALGALHVNDLFAVPGEPVGLSLSLTTANPAAPAPSLLRLSHADSAYADYPVAAASGGNAFLSFPAPAATGDWAMRWQKNDGGLLAEAPLRVTTNADAPHLEITSERDALGEDQPLPVTIKSVTDAGAPAPLVGGHIMAAWQRLDPATAGWKESGWKDYLFGAPSAHSNAAIPVADFLTDLQGEAHVRVTLPARPAEPGLYQIMLTGVAEADAGIADTPPLVVPLRPDGTVIGVKPLVAGGPANARFAQNGIARFALIALSSEGKPREMPNLSYQIYEEGRSFAWYQDEGRWKYKPEPQLRPIGGGDLSIKSDGGSILEWPVTAGNYRLEILDSSGKTFAATGFSAGWDSAGPSVALTAPLNVTLPKILQPGVPAAAHVTLPEPAMLTAIIADTRIRKIVHEFRAKGSNAIAFTPDADWRNGLSLTVEATPQDGGVPLRGESESALTPDKKTADDAHAAGVSIVATEPPAALMLRKGDDATLTFALENKGDQPETYRIVFTASPGLKIKAGDKGSVTIGARQSRSLTVSLAGEEAGTKELRLEVAGSHTARVSGAWNIAVLAKNNFLRSIETVAVAPRQSLIASLPAKTRDGDEPAFALISRHSMDGLPEILAYIFNAHPFTTAELAAGIEALRLWGDTLAAAGIAPDFTIAARRQAWLLQLLRHQNPDGGFAALPGPDGMRGGGAMEDTAAALTALGPDPSALAAPARTLAIGWIKQRLANTWFDEKEREPRAAAYAALAAADAIEPSSLHYFSDTGAHGEMAATGDAAIAAAFKHIGDPDAAAFWIKKMLDEHKGEKSMALLGALAATDALSSDDVHAAMVDMIGLLRNSTAPGILNAAALLRAIAADNKDAGDWRLASGNRAQSIAGVLALRLPDAAAAALRNDDAGTLSVTFAAEAARPPSDLPTGASLTRHVYRLNGVELPPQAKPAAGEIYIVEIKGSAPEIEEDQQILLHDGASSALRPIGCPLSPGLDTPSFMPWFTMRDLTHVSACERVPHDLNVVVEPAEGSGAIRVVYFAYIDAPQVAAILPPRLRILK